MSLPPDQRDSQLKSALESEKKLHPALFSAASEHKVGFNFYILLFHVLVAFSNNYCLWGVQLQTFLWKERWKLGPGT